jgi:hypothetical protein
MGRLAVGPEALAQQEQPAEEVDVGHVRVPTEMGDHAQRLPVGHLHGDGHPARVHPRAPGRGGRR